MYVRTSAGISFLPLQAPVDPAVGGAAPAGDVATGVEETSDVLTGVPALFADATADTGGALLGALHERLKIRGFMPLHTGDPSHDEIVQDYGDYLIKDGRAINLLEINYAYFSARTVNVLRMFVNRFLEWTKMPIIIDFHEDHGSRRNALRSLVENGHEDDVKRFENNRLRINVVGGIVSLMEMVLERLRDDIADPDFWIGKEGIDRIWAYKYYEKEYYDDAFPVQFLPNLPEDCDLTKPSLFHNERFSKEGMAMDLERRVVAILQKVSELSTNSPI